MVSIDKVCRSKNLLRVIRDMDIHTHYYFYHFTLTFMDDELIICFFFDRIFSFIK
jgi:hypothetical protein